MDRGFDRPFKRALVASAMWLRRFHQHNPARRARANVAHHYDLSDRLYALFLGGDRQYSCGYFTHSYQDIDKAQIDKKRHLAAKLLLEPGQRILDIGSGWGGLALYLADDGVALLHSIGRMDGPGVTNDWIRKYIFPGGYSPALSQVLPVAERGKLWVTDIEVLRLHYAETLCSWRERFLANRSEIAKLYDERFCRMWDFYLVGSEWAFRAGGHMVSSRCSSRGARRRFLLTRDYIADWERDRLSGAMAAD